MEWIRWFDDVTMTDVASVGGRMPSLGEMRAGCLTQLGIGDTRRVRDKPPMLYRGLLSGIAPIRRRRPRDGPCGYRHQPTEAVARRPASRVRSAIRGRAFLPAELMDAVQAGYRRLQERFGPNCDVAVRSSATAEDLPDASFAGQQETFLNVHGEPMLLEACQALLRLAVHRSRDRLPSRTRASINRWRCRSACSRWCGRISRAPGVMFSIDTETGFRDARPDQRRLRPRRERRAGHGQPRRVLRLQADVEQRLSGRSCRRSSARKSSSWCTTTAAHGRRETFLSRPTTASASAIATMTMLTLARWAVLIEDHYSARGQPTPMDIEWAKDGRPASFSSSRRVPKPCSRGSEPTASRPIQLDSAARCWRPGRASARRSATGRCACIDARGRSRTTFKPGEVLVTDKTDPDWEPVMKQAAAIVTNRGGRTCHAAIVSRELGIPAIVGTGDAAPTSLRTAQRSRCRAPKGTRASSTRGRCRSRSSGRISPICRARAPR